MTFIERIDCLGEAWNNAKETTHYNLTSKENREVDLLFDILDEIAKQVKE